jgi:IclR family transcriptional regulator, mhp operon transcriptional activator
MVPAGDHMEIRETSRTRSPILLQQERIGLQVDWLLTAVGRAYLAFCPANERQRVINMLRSSPRLEDRLAREPERLNAILAETRARGYGTRDARRATLAAITVDHRTRTVYWQLQFRCATARGFWGRLTCFG